MYRISELAALCGVSPRTVDYYTRRGLLEPTERSSGRQRHYDEQAAQRLCLIKELQAERLTLREITDRLATSTTPSPAALAASIRALDSELERLNRQLIELAPQLEQTHDLDDRQAVAQEAGLALSKTLVLAQWLAALARAARTDPLVR